MLADTSFYNCACSARTLSLNDDDGGASSPYDLLANATPSSDEQLAAGELSSAVSTFLQSLSPRDRELVYSVYWLDELQSTIAARRGVSRMAISKALARIHRLGRIALHPTARDFFGPQSSSSMPGCMNEGHQPVAAQIAA